MATSVYIVDFECDQRLRICEDGGHETRWEVFSCFEMKLRVVKTADVIA
jgi:hypothetical protein